MEKVKCPICGIMIEPDDDDSMFMIDGDYAINTDSLGRALQATYCNSNSTNSKANSTNSKGCDAVFSSDGTRVYSIYHKQRMRYFTTLPLEMI